MELAKANLVDNPQNIVKHRIMEYCFFYIKSVSSCYVDI